VAAPPNRAVSGDVEPFVAPIEAPPNDLETPAEPGGVSADHVEPTRPRRRRLVAMLSLIGLAVAAFAIGLLVFNNMIMPRLVHSLGEVRVPDLGNLTVEQGEQALRPLGLTLSRAGERFDPSVPRGFIITQDPAPETPVRGKKLVTVVVSLGEEF